MRTFKLTLEYDGTDFNGWQLQANANRTVQGVLEAALSKIFSKKRVVVIGSGRTDAGVHARGQVAHFRMDTDMPADELMRALNFNLSDDVVVIKAEEASADFHAQWNAKSKTYSYTILNRRNPSALERERSLYYPRRLNLALMRREAKELVGRKDFRSFANIDPSRTGDAVRTIKRLEVKKRGDFIQIVIQADGFLYKMVRNIVGTLLDVGSGRFPPGSIKKILKIRDRRSAGVAVLPQGLCLEKVEY